MAPKNNLVCCVLLALSAILLPRESKAFASSCVKPSTRYRLIVGNDGPTTLGGVTTFTAQVENPYAGETNKIPMKYCWQIPGFEETCKKTLSRMATFKFGGWRTFGLKTVKVVVFIFPGKGSSEYCVANRTKFAVTDTINAKLKATQAKPDEDGTFHVGPVNLTVNLHDPSHLFNVNDITSVWHFDDGTSQGNITALSLVHHFTEDRVYHLVAYLAAWGSSGRFYKGVVHLNLDIWANPAPRLVIYGIPGPTLPNPKGVVVIAVGKADFYVKYEDPTHLVERITSQWEFHEDGGPSHKFATANHISYDFTRQTNYSLWVTSELHTKNHKYGPFAKQKNLLILEPIKHLNLEHTQHMERRTIFNVSCQGSGPISFCWYIAKKCSLPVNNKTICSPTMERTACRILINHTFESPGEYCLHLTAKNEVSSASTSLEVRIPDDSTPTGSGHSGTIVLVIFLCIVIVLVVALLVRKMMSYKARPVESANFDFRDDDCRSVSSVDFNTGHRCFPFGSCAKRGEATYLLSDFGTRRTSDMYKL